MAKIRTDDNVIVISGKDKGKTGKVLRVEPANAARVRRRPEHDQAPPAPGAGPTQPAGRRDRA